MAFFSAKKIDDEQDYMVPAIIKSQHEEDLFEVISLDQLLEECEKSEEDIIGSISFQSIIDEEDDEEDFDESKLNLPPVDFSKRYTTVIKDIFESRNINDELNKVAAKDDLHYFTSKQIADLTEENKGLVFACAKKFHTDSELKEELICVGMGALGKALGEFDKSREYKLSTYLVPCIRNAMINFLNSYSKDPIVDAISLYSIQGEETGERESLLEVYAIQNNEFMPSAEELVLSRERREQVRNCLNLLNAVENFVIRHLFGINDVDIYTQKELGEIMGIAQPNISEIKRRALKKLKKIITKLMENGYW